MSELKLKPSDELDPEWMKKFKMENTTMSEALAQKFASNLNSYYEKMRDPTRFAIVLIN